MKSGNKDFLSERPTTPHLSGAERTLQWHYTETIFMPACSVIALKKKEKEAIFAERLRTALSCPIKTRSFFIFVFWLKYWHATSNNVIREPKPNYNRTVAENKKWKWQ